MPNSNNLFHKSSLKDVTNSPKDWFDFWYNSLTQFDPTEVKCSVDNKTVDCNTLKTQYEEETNAN